MEQTNDNADLVFQLEVAETVFQKVRTEDNQEAMFNACHAKLLRKTIAALRQPAPKDEIEHNEIADKVRSAIMGCGDRSSWGQVHIDDLLEVEAALRQLAVERDSIVEENKRLREALHDIQNPLDKAR